MANAFIFHPKSFGRSEQFSTGVHLLLIFAYVYGPYSADIRETAHWRMRFFHLSGVAFTAGWVQPPYPTSQLRNCPSIRLLATSFFSAMSRKSNKYTLDIGAALHIGNMEE